MQLVTMLLEKIGTSILKEPSQIITFVDYALGESNTGGTAHKEAPRREGEGSTLRMADLKIVDDEAPREEDEGEGGLAAREEIIMTGLTLLLAVLEGADLLLHVLRVS
jgi:hypothetical protein